MEQQELHQQQQKLDLISDKFKIKINDGFCEWEYELPTNGNVSIKEIANLIFNYYDKETPKGKQIKNIKP